MDGVDYQVLVALLDQPTASWETLGAQAGRSGTTVAQRVTRMQDGGLLRGLRLLPDPRFFGRIGVGYLVGPDAPVRDPDDLPDTLWSMGYDDGTRAYMAAPRPDDLDAVVAALGRVLGPAQMIARVDLRRTNDPLDPLADTLSPLDWRILRALVLDPRIALSELAERTGLTRRTVRRHRDALIDAGHAVAVPLLNQGTAPGVVLHHVLVFGTDRFDMFRGPRRMPYVRFREPPGVGLFCVDDTIAEARATVDAIRGLSGVQEVLGKVPINNRVADARLVTWLDAQVAHWDRARRQR